MSDFKSSVTKEYNLLSQNPSYYIKKGFSSVEEAEKFMEAYKLINDHIIGERTTFTILEEINFTASREVAVYGEYGIQIQSNLPDEDANSITNNIFYKFALQLEDEESLSIIKEEEPAKPAKRGRGRPKGSKNKPKA